MFHLPHQRLEPALPAYWVGSKRNSKSPVDSPGPASKRHFFTASRAAFANTGCPPTTFVFLIDPLGDTVIWTFTTPVMFMRFARSGYTGATLVFIFRSTSCPDARGALVATHPPTSSRPIATARFRPRMDTYGTFLVACIFLIFEQRTPQRIPKVLSLHYFGDLCKAMKNRSLVIG